MKFSIAIHSSVFEKTQIIRSLSEDLKEYFKDKNYGQDVQDYSVLCRCISPQFEDFYKDAPYKPRYVAHRITKNRFTGLPHEMNKIFMNEFVIKGKDYDDFIKVDEDNRKKIVAVKLLNSLCDLDKLPKKVKDFDKERFKNDLKDFFIKNNLISN